MCICFCFALLLRRLLLTPPLFLCMLVKQPLIPQDCGWAAYAYIGSYDQYYQGAYYSYAGVQLHEHGHNMYLAHSGGLNGATYTE